MDLTEAFAAAVTASFFLAVVCWAAWFIIKNKSTEVRDTLLRQYANILAQLDEITKLQEEFNALCADQSFGAILDDEPIKKFLATAKSAFNEIESLPAWKVLGRYPRYWYLAETHAKYFAPAELQLRDTIRDIKPAPAA
jgi:hypothetical protein